MEHFHIYNRDLEEIIEIYIGDALNYLYLSFHLVNIVKGKLKIYLIFLFVLMMRHQHRMWILLWSQKSIKHVNITSMRI